MMIKQLEHGYATILRVSEYKDNDVLLTMLIEDIGQIRLIGKGQLKTTSKLAPICQPFNTLLIGYYRRHDATIGQLIQASCMVARSDITFEFYPNIYGQILCELIEKITFDDYHDVGDLYPFINNALDNLNNSNIHNVFAFYLLTLIKGCGYLFDIDNNIIDRNEVIKHKGINFNIEQGCLQFYNHYQDNIRDIDIVEVLVIIYYLQADSFTQVSDIEDEISFNTILYLLDYIQYHFGFSLKSYKLLKQL